jgi:hypothetical protein
MKKIQYNKLGIIFFFFLLLIQTNCLSQINSGLRGEVFDVHNNPVDYFNVLLFSVSDSSFVQGGTFTNGYFEINNLKDQSYILKISSIQYTSRDTIINLNQNRLNVGRFYLEELVLPEFVVEAKRPIFKQKEGVMILDVKNSFLKDAGQLLDVLKRCPGIIVDYQGNVSVSGKGAPVIFINKKEVYSKEELTSLESNNIESIEIDYNPLAEYNATAHTVIRIKTRKPLEDYFSSTVSNNTYLGRRFSDKINLTVGNKLYNISNYFSYSYTDFSSIQYDISSQTIIRPNDTVFSRKQATLTNHNNSHHLFYSMDYAPDKKNLLGIQYSGSTSVSHPERMNEQTVSEINKEDINRSININGNKHNYLHNISANYTLNISAKNTFSLVGDYAFAKSAQKENIFEQNKNDNLSTKQISTNQDRFNVLGVQAEFNSNLEYLNYKAGIKYSKIKDNGYYNFNAYSYSNHLKDEIIASFVSLKKSFGLYTVSAGIRGEYTNSIIHISDRDKPVIDTTHYSLFPSLQVNKKISEKTELTLNYSRRINRPGFNQINPRFNYLDSLSYMVGNPLLKPALSNVIELKATFSDLSFSIGYRRITNQIVYFEETDSENSNRIKYTFNNIDKGEYWLCNLTYSFTLSNISGLAGLYLSKPFVNVTFLDTKYKLRKPIGQFTVNFDYNMLDNTSLNCSFFYQSSGETGLDYFKKSADLTLGFKQYFLNKKLYIAVEAEDILKTYNPNDWESRSHNTISAMDSNIDSRRIMVKISYDFGNLKVKNSKKSANEEERSRL